MVLRAAVDAGAGGTIVTSVTGTANQVTASPTTGAVILNLPANVQITTSLALGGATIGTNDIAGPQWFIRTSDGLFSTMGKIQAANNRINLNAVANGAITTISTGYFGFSTSSSDSSSGIDLFLSRGGPASFQLGSIDIDTGPIAQTLRTQGALAGGTSNVAGAPFTIIVSPGKGTGVGGTWALQTAPAGSTGTAVNAAVTRISADGPGNIIIGSAAIATNATDGFLYIPTCAGAPTGVPTAFTGRIAMVYDTTNDKFWFYNTAWKQPKTPAGAAIITWQ